MKRELEVVKFLLDEIENEITYFEKYEEARAEATKKAEEYNKSKSPDEHEKYYWSFLEMSDPKKSVINNNLKKIRLLCLKMYQ